MRSALAVLLPVLAGAVVYAGFDLGTTPDSWEQSSILLLPAVLVGLMLVGLVFLPLWSLLVRKTPRTRLVFVCVASATWVVFCAILAVLGAFGRSGGLESIASVLVPGLVVAATFGLLMDPRRARGSAADKK